MTNVRKRIIDAAISLFADKGISVPTAEVARAAGISNGSLFNYFATKQILIDATYASIRNELEIFLFANMEKPVDIKDATFIFWSRLIQWSLHNTNKQRVATMLGCSQKLSDDIIKQSHPIYSLINKVLEGCFEVQKIKPISKHLIGKLLCSYGEAIVAFIQSERRSAEETDAIVTQGFDLFWDGLASSIDPARKIHPPATMVF